MQITKWLVVDNKGICRIIAKLESAKGGEIPIKLTLIIPDTYWESPVVSANITLPEVNPASKNIVAEIDFENIGLKDLDEDLENL